MRAPRRLPVLTADIAALRASLAILRGLLQIRFDRPGMAERLASLPPPEPGPSPEERTRLLRAAALRGWQTRRRRLVAGTRARNCLCCGAGFDSSGSGNRLCAGCASGGTEREDAA